MSEKIRSWMYTQQVDYLLKNLECSNWDELTERLNLLLTDLQENNNLKEWAWILHDKDKSKDPGLDSAKPHIHFALHFNNSVASTLKIANYFNDPKAQHVTPFQGRGGKNNLYSYLVHRTKQAREQKKYQYDPRTVVASFDYVDRLAKITKAVSITQEDIDEYLHRYSLGEYTREGLLKEIGPVVASRSSLMSQLKNLDALMREDDARQWREKMAAENRRVEVVYIWGEGGVGKTRLAKHHASEYAASLSDIPYFAEGVYTTASQKDMFDRYDNQRAVVLDDVRPNAFNAQWFLNLFDPYLYDKVAESRYRNKRLTANRYYITSSLDPTEFFELLTGKHVGINENLGQFARRMQFIHLTHDRVYQYEYERVDGENGADPVWLLKRIRDGPKPEFLSVQAEEEQKIDFFKEFTGGD